VSRIQKTLIYIGIVLILLGGTSFVYVKFLHSRQRGIPVIYSNNAVLLETWNNYKAANLEASSGRTIDHSQPGNITTSEGQSYTMLRAVWMDDQPTFDRSLASSQSLMQRPDSLFSWRYGELSNGSYGIQTSVGGNNTASDGDVEIAFALLMAYHRWNDNHYLAVSQSIIRSIWDEEVVQVDGKPVLVADDIERNSKTDVVVDPSYFDPAAFKVFAQIDPGQDWNGLVNNSYSILSELSSSNLGGTRSDGLPPDWIEMNRVTGQIIPDATPTLDTNYGYDAFRIPFRLALDYEWFKDPRDKAVLAQFAYLHDQWQQNHKLDTVYAHSGSVIGDYETPAMYGASIGYFMVADPTDARAVYTDKLTTLYSPDLQGWKNKMGYYDDNWAWFGLALYQGALPNLTGVTE
jgi:endo-1,4-beta-D-glucanase Y